MKTQDLPTLESIKLVALGNLLRDCFASRTVDEGIVEAALRLNNDWHPVWRIDEDGKVSLVVK